MVSEQDIIQIRMLNSCKTTCFKLMLLYLSGLFALTSTLLATVSDNFVFSWPDCFNNTTSVILVKVMFMQYLSLFADGTHPTSL